nr:MAG: tripartite terminase subunit 1 [Peromyscus leucopus gammaherpesvirus]
MAQELAAVYSQIYGFSLELSVLLYLNPHTLNLPQLHFNRKLLRHLNKTLVPLLITQNNYETSALSLELEHLLKNCLVEIDRLIISTERHLPVTEYFHQLHLSDPCNFHQTVLFSFYNDCIIKIDLHMLNDVEVFFKRLNSVFFCIGSKQALEGLNEMINFLGNIRGISPIPPPEIYISNIACLNCLHEAILLPNQGESQLTMLNQGSCKHVCVPICNEPIKGLFENELKQMRLTGVRKENQAPETATDTEYSNVNTSDDLFHSHNIFQPPTQTLIELSNLLYWNTEQLNQIGPSVPSTSPMVELLQLEKQGNVLRDAFSMHQGTDLQPHFFDIHKPYPLERLFCGGLFSSIEDTITALKHDCATSFMQKHNYSRMVQKKNELFSRLKEALRSANNTQGKQEMETGNVTSLPSPITDENVQRDAQARKDAYFQKVAKDGLQRLTDCVEANSAVLTNTLEIRSWGSTVYEFASNLKNHFLIRQAVLGNINAEDMSEFPSGFENSKFIKNAMYIERLSKEHVEATILVFYRLLKGPLVPPTNLFPLPDNIILGINLEAAGALPHQKLNLTEMIWPEIEPKHWINSQFNSFYQLTSNDLTQLQNEAWKAIRELVLSVTLFNRIWKRDLKVNPITYINIKEVQRGINFIPDGIYITYEMNRPLILVFHSQGWIFKDLYSLLYHYMQHC